MKRRFVWLVLVFVVTFSMMACGGTSFDDISGDSNQQIEESEKQGIGITFMDANPDYSNISECKTRQRTLIEEEIGKLGENEYLVTDENQISDSIGNLTIDELQRNFEGTLVSEDSAGDLEEEAENLNESAPEQPSRNLNATPCFFNLFCANVHGMDHHPLEPCVFEYVDHFNIALMKDKKDLKSPTKYWMNLHVGAYRRNSDGNLCIVIFEKVKNGPVRVCWTKCSPSRPDLQRALEQSMKSVLASIKISVSATALATAAYTLSYLIFPALMAL